MIAQLIVNAIVAGSCCVFVALGLWLIYGVYRFFHFGLGGTYLLGAYVAFAVIKIAELPLLVGLVVGIMAAAVAGGLMDVLVFEPLHRKGSSSLVLMLASLGIMIALQSVLSLVFGDETLLLRRAGVPLVFTISGAHITFLQTITVGVVGVLGMTCLAWSRFTRGGKEIRAMLCDSKLADVVGIPTRRLRFLVLIVSSALAGLAGILISLDMDLTAGVGMRVVLLGIVAIIVGGPERLAGPFLGAYLLAFAQHLGGACFSMRWQDAITFGILFVFLLFKPRGVLGSLASEGRH